MHHIILALHRFILTSLSHRNPALPLLCTETILLLMALTHTYTRTHPHYLYTCPPEPNGFTLAITEWVTAALLHQSLMGNKNEMHFSGNMD